MRAQFFWVGVFVFLTGIIGCAEKQGPVSPEEVVIQKEALPKPYIFSVDVFMARGFLNGSNYERYFLADDVLWRECGEVLEEGSASSRPKQLEGDEFLTNDPKLNIVERRVESVSKKQSNILQEAARSINAPLQSERATLPAPGELFSLTAPGLLEVRILQNGKSTRFITSVDATSTPETPAQRATNELVTMLRSIGPVICNSKTFYGIGRVR